MRVFISLDLPKEILSEIKKIQDELRERNYFEGKLTEVRNLHLTLKFLGEIEEAKLKEIEERLNKIKISEFSAKIGEFGVFSKNHIRIIWISLKSKELNGLQKEIDNNLKDLFGKEERFMSHITIARVKKVHDKEELINFIKKFRFKNLEFKIKEFFLKKSELYKEGPKYNVIKRYFLI